MKEAFLVKLGPEDATWVEQQALVFGSRSAVLRLVVRITRILISCGKIQWTFEWLQERLRGEEGNQRNPAAQVAGETGALHNRPPVARPPRQLFSHPKGEEELAWFYPRFLPTETNRVGFGSITP
jgi:hypothetical protein